MKGKARIVTFGPYLYLYNTMKKILLISILATLSFHSFAQTKAEKMFASIKNQFTVDENKNVTYVRIIDSLDISKDEVYTRALNYFSYKYVSIGSVIETRDKDLGLIVAKGKYENVHVGYDFAGTSHPYSCWHILRVDIKDGKARIILSLTQMEEVYLDSYKRPATRTYNIGEAYPINPNASKIFDTMQTKAFCKSHDQAIISINALEKAIREGSTSKSIEKDKW